MKKYLIFPTYDNYSELKHLYFIVKAPTKKIAILLYSTHYAQHDYLLIESLNIRSYNFSFAEKFWIHTDEEKKYFANNGDVLITEQEFKNRVKKFFKNKPEFSDIYLNYYFSEYSEEDVENFDWPLEMLAYIFQKDFDPLDFEIIDLDHIQIITN